MFARLFASILLLVFVPLAIVAMKTTTPVSIVLNGIDLRTWIQRSLWNVTRMTIVHHLNDLCRKDSQCDAEYGAANIHLIDAVHKSSSSIRLSISADQPIVTSNNTLEHKSVVYNYTGLLTDALFRTKIDIEHRRENDSWNSALLSSNTNSSTALPIQRTNRLLFVFLGIVLVAIVFGFTVLFFQRIRRHDYSKLLKNVRIDQQQTMEESFNQSSTPLTQHA